MVRLFFQLIASIFFHKQKGGKHDREKICCECRDGFVAAMRKPFVIHIAQDADLQKIINFFSQPHIDRGFCKPLSERNITIPERVFLKHNQGIWVFAEIDQQIVSCGAIIPDGKGVSISTFACINDVNCKIAGASVWENILKLAKEHFVADYIEIDSWVGNEFINRFLTKRGFEKIKTFSDPDKRPASVESVLYQMILR